MALAVGTAPGFPSGAVRNGASAPGSPTGRPYSSPNASDL